MNAKLGCDLTERAVTLGRLSQGDKPCGKEIHTLWWQQWEMFSTDLLHGHHWECGGGCHCLSDTLLSLWFLRKIVHALSASHWEWITLACAQAEREADWAGSTQLQPIKLKLPLKLVNDKKTLCFHLSIYPSSDTREKSLCRKMPSFYKSEYVTDLISKTFIKEIQIKIKM